MSDMWIIAVSLPLLIINSILLGFEVSFFYGISLIGLSLSRLGTGERLKRTGTIICVACILLFFMSFSYYITAGIFFPESPFEFKAMSFYLHIL
jgi:hypothetical protein